MTRPSARGRPSSKQPHGLANGLLKDNKLRPFDTPLIDQRVATREPATNERDPPSTCSSDFDHSKSKFRVGGSTWRKSSNLRKEHRSNWTANSRETRTKDGSRSAESQVPQKDKNSGKLRDHNSRQSVTARSALTEKMRHATELAVEPRRDPVAEIQLQAQRQAAAISNRLERKQNISEKTKTAVLKAMMCKPPTAQDESTTTLPTKAIPFLESPKIGTTESQRQGSLKKSDVWAFNRDQSGFDSQQKPVGLYKTRTVSGKHAQESEILKFSSLHITSHLQQKLWLKKVLEAISEARVSEVPRPALQSPSPAKVPALRSFELSQKLSHPTPPSSPRRVAFVEQTEEKLHSMQVPPVMSFLSSDDDDESVSSVVLLFNYLSCNAVPDQKLQINERGNLVLVESFDAGKYSVVSDMSMKEQHFRRYQLVCSP